MEACSLIVNGSFASGTAVTVTGGTLGGTGIISGSVAINAAATIAPGDAGIGTLHTGPITLAGNYACEISDATSDVLSVTGDLILTGSTLTVTGTSSAASLVIATFSGSCSGTFAAAPAGYSIDYTSNTITLVKAGFNSWATDNGVTGGPTGDSDHDGIANLVEYALNLNPAAADGSAGSFDGTTATFTKRAQAITNADVRYVIETSQDLITWAPVVTQNPGDPGYADATISYALPAGQEKTFLRLAVTEVP